MSPKIHTHHPRLLKGFALSCLSLMLVTTPVNPPTTLAQGVPGETAGAQAEVEQLFQQGNQELQQSQPDAALATFQRALMLARQYRLRSYEASALGNIGYVYGSIGQSEKALEYYAQALPIFKEVKNHSGEAWALASIGRVYSSIDQPEKALEYYAQALPIFREVKDRSGEANTLTNIGAVYSLIGQPEKALEFFTQALLITREVKGRSGEATTLTSIGLVYSRIGQPEKALKHFTQALHIYREVKNRNGEANALISIGTVYGSIGQSERALEYYAQSLIIYQEVKDRNGEAGTLHNIGVIYRRMGQSEKALGYYTQALPIFREVKDRVGEAGTLTTIGVVYGRIGQPEKALDYYTQSLAIYKEVKDRNGEAMTLTNIGEVYTNISQPERALQCYTQALSIFREVKDRSGEANTLVHLSWLSQHQGNLDTALQQIEAVIYILETTRSEIKSTDLRTSYFASVQNYYRFYTNLLMQLHKRNPSQGYDQKALLAAERARARGLNDLLNEARVDIRQGVDPTLLNRERSLLSQLQTQETRRVQLLSSNAPADQLKQLEQDYATLQQQYQQTQDQIRATSPRYAALTQPQPLTLKEIQALLDDNTLLLQYSLGADRSYLWLVSREGLQSYELPKSAEIDTLARQYLKLLTDKNSLKFQQQELEQVGAKLSQLLLAPIASELGQKRLVVVADGALQYLPFAALPLPGTQKPLLTNHEIVNLPSATTLGLLRQDEKQRTQASKMIAVLADPVFGKDDSRFTASTQVATQPADPNLNQLSLTRSAANIGIKFARLPSTTAEANNILQTIPANQRFVGLGFAANLENAEDIKNPMIRDFRFIEN